MKMFLPQANTSVSGWRLARVTPLLLSASISMAFASSAQATVESTPEESAKIESVKTPPGLINTINGRLYTIPAPKKKQDSGTTSSASEVTVILPDDLGVPANHTAGLGAGYNSITEKVVSNSAVYVTTQDSGNPLPDGGDTDSITDEAVWLGNTITQFFVGIDLAQKDISDMLTGGASGDVKYSSLSVQGSIDAAIKSSSDQYTGSYTLVARVTPRKAVLFPESVAYTPPGKSTVPADKAIGTGGGLLYPSNDMVTWANTLSDVQEKVGDEYIEAIELGSWLVVTLKFEYMNSQDKKDIGGQIKVDWAGQVGVEGGGSFSSIKGSENVKVSIYGRQYGGDADEIQNILSPNVISCSLNSPSACFASFSQAIDYMRDDYRLQFYSGNTLLLNKFAPVRYFTNRYDAAGSNLSDLLDTPLERLTFQSRQTFRKAHSLWETSRAHQRRANDLKNNAFAGLTGAEISELQSIESIASNNATTIESFIGDCLSISKPASYCADNWPLTTINSYDETLLEVY